MVGIFYFMYFVYIIQSETDGSYYKGFSMDYEKRLIEHNLGLSSYTSRKTPWKLVYAEKHDSKSSALKREKNLKKAARERIEALIVSNKNILNT
jgi:putative endonuclease